MQGTYIGSVVVAALVGQFILLIVLGAAGVFHTTKSEDHEIDITINESHQGEPAVATAAAPEEAKGPISRAAKYLAPLALRAYEYFSTREYFSKMTQQDLQDHSSPAKGTLVVGSKVQVVENPVGSSGKSSKNKIGVVATSPEYLQVGPHRQGSQVCWVRFESDGPTAGSVMIDVADLLPQFSWIQVGSQVKVENNSGRYFNNYKGTVGTVVGHMLSADRCTVQFNEDGELVQNMRISDLELLSQ